MQDDKLRDFLKFFRFHLAWFILSAGFFAVILVSGLFLSTRYVVDTASQQEAIPSATPEQLEIAVTETPEAPAAQVEPEAPELAQLPEVTSTPEPIVTINPTPTPLIKSTPSPIATPAPIFQPESETPTPVANPDNKNTYVVRSGDSLWKIAQQKYGDGHHYLEIAEINAVKNPDQIAVGQSLQLPTSSTTPDDRPQITGEAWSQDTTVFESYSIQSGDSLWEIASEELGDPYRWMEIYQANQSVIGDNPDLIYPTVILKIPTDSPPVSVAPSTQHWTSSLLQ